MKWRPRFQWRIRDAEIPLGPRTLVVGILDVNSLSETTGKAYHEAGLRAAEELERLGADLVDVTAQAEPIEGKLLSADEELRRLVPVLRRLRHNLRVPVCVSTCHAETAARVLELDAAAIHDFSGLASDPGLARVVSRQAAGLIIGHCRGTPETWNRLPPLPDVMELVLRDLDSSIARARAAGIDRRHVVIDPGLNLGKRGAENLDVLAQVGRLAQLGQPIQISPSRKPFLVESVRATDREWFHATAAVAVAAACEGVHLLRVREVAEVTELVKPVDRMLELLWLARPDAALR
jgi:dihydropteroate synthase